MNGKTKNKQHLPLSTIIQQGFTVGILCLYLSIANASDISTQSNDRDYSDLELANRQLVINIFEQVLQPLDSSKVDTFIHPEYIQHSPLAESGAEGLKKFLDWARKASPNAEHRMKRIFVDKDHVIVHSHVIITPGERGNAVIDIFRIENGLIIEHWDSIQAIPEHSANSNGIF